MRPTQTLLIIRALSAVLGPPKPGRRRPAKLGVKIVYHPEQRHGVIFGCLGFARAHPPHRTGISTHVQILTELWDDRNDMMKLVEEYAGVGNLDAHGGSIPQVRYRIARYQGFVEPSGLPVPGVHRIEGSVDTAADLEPLIGQSLTLRLEDGRAIAITIADTSGRVLAEGHGPSRCLCC